ncbi:hypothetical protein P2G88_12590 [Aliiglaciecola sp. CAU 1673]|uniref:hypothetical protein n=1 Tax=Aliiglaciecola sp. CAU 1673 TaxID=3032595 RepID=UPI0023DA205A|nr:hypothetical protein [Aliiglaciecola sp. CAU 1673]MDF2179090.1 hypothetical protein [Aliiglaciecola sp. CAU 1673]
MSKAEYFIQRIGDVLYVKLQGEWDLATDIAYLTKLCEEISKIQARKRPWGMLVDMQAWQMDNFHNKLQPQTANIPLDRRNQRCECWLVNDDNQALDLEKFIRSKRTINFGRHLQLEPALDWLEKFGLNLQRSRWRRLANS